MLQRTIDGELVMPSPDAPILPQLPRPVLIHCVQCGASAIGETTSGSMCQSCAESAELTECGGCADYGPLDDFTEIGDGHYCHNCSEEYVECYECEEAVASDDTVKCGDELYCPSCRDNHLTQCTSCNGYELDDEVTSDRYNSLCQRCADQYIRCDDCDQLAPSEEVSQVRGDDWICQSCFDEDYFNCASCDDNYHNDYYSRCGRCDDCWGSLDEDERAELIVEYEHSRMSAPSAPVRPAIPHGWRKIEPAIGSIRRTGTLRSFGLEIETSACGRVAELDGKTVFSPKLDGTVTGFEFVSVPLSSDSGLRAVERFSTIAEQSGFAVDDKCGVHLHIDTGGIDNDGLIRIAHAYRLFEPVWQALVPPERRQRSYCAPIPWTVENGSDGYGIRYKDVVYHNIFNFAHAVNRYAWANFASLAKHRTIENRLLHGTLSAPTLTNWIVANLAFVEHFKDIPHERIVAIENPISYFIDILPHNVGQHMMDMSDIHGFNWREQLINGCTCELCATFDDSLALAG